MMKDDDFKLFRGFCDLYMDEQMNKQMNEQMDICECRVAFATKN